MIIKSTNLSTHQPIEDDVLYFIIEQNKKNENHLLFSFRNELKNFIGFSKTMIWAFPIALFMRWKIRKNKQLKQILQFKELLTVRNNIEKGSFAYDSLLFNENIFSLLKNKSHLANLVCLSLLFGDEFIDGIATTYGKKNVQYILNNEKFNFNLQYKNRDNNTVELFYEFDICELLPLHILNAVNTKYEISYKEFYQHLLFLLKEINRNINKLKYSLRDEAAQLICKACNKCFNTYKEDITSFNANYSFADLQHYQKTKDDDIIQVLLTLRALLLGKKQLNYQAQFTSWSSMVRSMQLYDDIQDIAHDYNFQINTVAFFAKNYFVNEWEWLLQNSELLKQQKGISLHAMVSLYMPASVILTMQYARNISHKLSWVQHKIENYLWCKNWLGIKNKLLKEKSFCLSSIMSIKNPTIAFKLHLIKKHVNDIIHPLITTEMKFAHAIDIVLFDDELSNLLHKENKFKETYFLKSCFVKFPLEQKAKYFIQLLNSYS